MIAPFIRPRTVTVVIPLYNYGQFVVDALESVRGQTFTDWNCWVVDDASTDDGPEVAVEWIVRTENASLDFSYVQLPENGGTAAARNKGVEMSASSGSRWIVPLDADDMLAPEFLSRCLAAAERENADWVYTDLWVFKGAHGAHHDGQRENGVPPGMVSRSALEEAGGYDGALREKEDRDLSVRLAVPFRSLYLREPLYRRRYGHDSKTARRRARGEA